MALIALALHAIRFYWDRPGRTSCSIERWECPEVDDDLARCTIRVVVAFANHTREDWVIPYLFFSRRNIVKRKPEDRVGNRAEGWYDLLTTETGSDLTGIDPDTRRFQAPIVVPAGMAKPLQFDMSLPFRPFAFRVHTYSPRSKGVTTEWEYFDPAETRLAAWLLVHRDSASRQRAIMYLLSYPSEHPPFDYYGLPTPKRQVEDGEGSGTR